MLLPKNIRAASTPEETVIHIEGEIGAWDWNTGTTNDAQWLRDLLATSAAPAVRVVINSPGGSAFDGLAIYNTLRASGKRVVTECLALAASAASIVFCAGDERRMAPGALLMIHNALTCAAGEADDLRKTADILDTVSASLAEIYAKTTGHDAATIAAWMDAETWMDGAFAKQHGFATAIATDATGAPAARIAACASLTRFKNLPAALKPAARITSNATAITMNPKVLEALGLTAESTAEQIDAAILALHEANAKLKADAAAAEAKARDAAAAKLKADAEAAVAEAVTAGALTEAERPQALADYLAAPEASARLLAKLTAAAKAVVAAKASATAQDGHPAPLAITASSQPVSVDALRAAIAEAEAGEPRAALYRAHPALIPVQTGAKSKFAKADPATAKALGII